MKLSNQNFLRGVLLSLLALICISDAATAASRRPSTKGKKEVAPESVRTVQVSVTEEKKTSTVSIQCLGASPGKAAKIKKSKKGMMSWLTFAQLAKSADTARAKSRFKLLQKNGAVACAASSTPGEGSPPGSSPNPNPGNPPPGTTPTLTPVPQVAEHLSLEKYTGPFGPAEARILYNRFAFGGTPQDIADAVNAGLDGTVAKLFTVVSEPELDARMSDLQCDSWFLDDPEAGNQNKTCSPNNINDFSRLGQRLEWLYRMRYSQNALQERLRLFFHDERLSVAQSAARDCEKHAMKAYMNDLWTLVTTGDYKNYMRAMNNSQLVHLRWLDGAANLGGVVQNRPNENYAREFWELGTVGPTDLNGSPVYSDLDVAQSSVALTGWTINQITIDGSAVCLAARSPLLHTPGLKTIFGGTPWQASIDNDEDLLNATFAHPRTSEHLAEDIWKQFINYEATPDSIRAMAASIRANNYNLLPVFKQVMTSKALFAAKSQKSLIKHPVDRVLSFVKTSGFPLNYRRIDAVVSSLEQQPLNPPSVFGWDEKRNAGDSLLLAWRNVVINEFININSKDVKTKFAWSYYDRFVRDLNQQGKTGSLDVINRVAQELGVTLNDKQRATLDQYMNFYPTTNGCPASCNGAAYRLERDKYDTDPQSRESGVEWGGQERIRGLVAIMLTSLDFLLK